MIDLFTSSDLRNLVAHLIKSRRFADPLFQQLNSESFCTARAYFLPYGTIPCRFCDRNKNGHREVLRNHHYSTSSYANCLGVLNGGVAGSKREYLMKRPEQTPATKGKNKPCPDEAFRKKTPNIAQYLCDEYWDDGKPRKVSSLGINMNNGCVTVSLSDHEYEQSAYTTAATLQEALELLEDALKDEKGIWRKWKRGK